MSLERLLQVVIFLQRVTFCETI